jgi:superfamily II DNA or RNA helicase
VNGPALRTYQTEIIEKFHTCVEAGAKRIIMVAPTGAGKTIIGNEIVKANAKLYRPVLVLAHRREIIGQTSRKLYTAGIPHGIIQAGFPARPMELVQVASIQTLWTRAMVRESMELPPADLLWIDEAHHCPAETYRKIIAAYPDVVLLGTTATPCRGDGRGLGGIFELIIETPQVAELIAHDPPYLVKTRVYAPVDPDLRGVRTIASDYVEDQLAERMNTDVLVGDIVSHWHKYGERRCTVAFAVSVAHSVHIRDEFIKSGVRAEHIDGSTPKDERDASLARLASGELEVVSNCMVLTEGWDMPECGCIILARPTKKMGLYRQMIGRVLRPSEGKPDAIVLDHSGAVFRHGFVEDHVEWTLDPDTKATSAAHQKRLAGGHKSRILECVQCGAVRVAGQACSNCGYLPAPPPRVVEFDEGELGLVDRKRHAQPDVYDAAARERFHAMLLWIANERSYKPGWAAHKYKEKFGAWPPWGSSPPPIPPTPEVRSWVRSRLIAYAKAQGAA